MTESVTEETHKVLSTELYKNGRIDRRQGSWAYYTAYTKNGDQCNFARKKDAERYLKRAEDDGSD